jgi:hypothetical protein
MRDEERRMKKSPILDIGVRGVLTVLGYFGV